MSPFLILQCYVTQWNAVQYYVMHDNAVQCSVMQCNTVHIVIDAVQLYGVQHIPL